MVVHGLRGGFEFEKEAGRSWKPAMIGIFRASIWANMGCTTRAKTAFVRRKRVRTFLPCLKRLHSAQRGVDGGVVPWQG